MRQIQDRSTRWILLSLLLAVTFLVITWQSNPSTTTAGTNPVVLKTESVASQDASFRTEFSSSAKLDGARSQDLLASLSHKLSPALRDQISFLLSNPQLDHDIPVIVRVNPDLWAQNAELEGNEFSKGNNKALSLINSYMTRLPAAQIKLLLESGAIEYITLDAPIRVVEPVTMDAPSGVHPSSPWAEPNHEIRNPFLETIGADQLGGYTGKGVTVAVFDSGINRHPDLDPSRILAAVDLTSGPPVFSEGHSDQYGHGTAVAGIVGGTGQESRGAYAGPAPEVSFVDLKVVGDDGSGLTSNLIQAIEWVIENKDLYDIRVANFSVGHPPLESYTTDPLNQAVRQLVESGVITVASGGNLGKASEYPEIWGAINSPANDPSVITVYPMKTGGTATHSDDTATTYGSRGPTYLDGLFKPDLAAPGNKIPSLLASGSNIFQGHPELQIDEHYITLSGSSMATPFVTGTIALMLEAKPRSESQHHKADSPDQCHQTAAAPCARTGQWIGEYFHSCPTGRSHQHGDSPTDECRFSSMVSQR